MKPLGLDGIVECDRVFVCAGRAEVVRAAADTDDERVVVDRARRRDTIAVLVGEGCDVNLPALPVEARHLADPVAEAMPVRLREVVRVVHRDVHAAGGDLVQMRLPEMRTRTLDQRDVGAPTSAERVAELRRELESAGTAADDDDAVQRSVRHGIGFGQGTGR